MFKLIKVDFYDDLKCLMSDCPDNCCNEDWDIYVDDDTLRLYEQVVTDDLYSKVSREEPHKIIKKDNKCPFFTSEGLCEFHRDYGEEYLSNTCRSYPRFVSTYGDVYLETLGLSCPATVMNVLKLQKPVVFPYNIYYEEGDDTTIRPGMIKAETEAYSAISEFVLGQSVIGSYLRLIGESADITVITKKEILSILADVTSLTPSERYVKELYTQNYISSSSDKSAATTDEQVLSIEEKLKRSNEYFSCNVNRMLVFEHMMLESQKERPDKTSVLICGLYIWLLLLMAFECKDDGAETYDENDMIERTYMLMRIVDHGGNAIEKLIEKYEKITNDRKK